MLFFFFVLSFSFPPRNAKILHQELFFCMRMLDILVQQSEPYFKRACTYSGCIHVKKNSALASKLYGGGRKMHLYNILLLLFTFQVFPILSTFFFRPVGHLHMGFVCTFPSSFAIFFAIRCTPPEGFFVGLSIIFIYFIYDLPSEICCLNLPVPLNH